MQKVSLYYYESNEIKISMELYFNELGLLIFDGYDIGKKVEELMGDIDYEYSYNIEALEVEKFYSIFALPSGDKAALLQLLKEQFGGNEAYSRFGNFMQENDIDYDAFTWR